jgi:membrane protease YdiL (CAAX protease family)
MVPGGIASHARHALAVQAERLAARADAPGLFGRRRPVLLVLGAYVAVGAGAAGLALAFEASPLTCNAWLGMSGAASVLSSLGLGLCIGAITIAATRVMVQRAAWAQALHVSLRPAVHRASDWMLLSIAAASATGEELLFRGLLVPLLGVVGSSVLFGALHQIRGAARWWWMAWATVMGLLFALVFRATGSLVGPIVAHALINAGNLRYLRDNDPAPPRRRLGGILRRGN